jgi:NSS family neurotransmitter:Na+ symporter
VFANGLSPGEGPGLIFVTLPLAFGNMAGGTILGLMFFLLLTFAALTSAISLLEPTVEMLEERTSLPRVSAALISGAAVWLLGVAALLSFNVWSDVLVFGLNIFDLLDTFTAKFLLPLTGLGSIVFAAWCLDRKSVEQELGLSAAGVTAWNVIARVVAPIGVVVVFITGVIGLM